MPLSKLHSPGNFYRFHASMRILIKLVICLIVIVLLCILFSKSSSSNTNTRITILTVLGSPSDSEKYQRAIDSVKCYSKIHGYNLIIASNRDYADRCKQKDKFFLRHCISAIEVQSSDYLLFIDADNGVVNPKRKIEEFIDYRFDVTFYDRFFNAEVAMGSYLLKNSKKGIDFMMEFSNYEKKLPHSFHGTDNGAIHAFLVSKIFPDKEYEYRICIDVWKKSKNFTDIFIYEACIRSLIGIREEFDNIRILRKGSAWVRDSWLTNSLWSPGSDFMIHDWKTKKLVKFESKDLPIRMQTSNQRFWYDPLVGEFIFDLCTPENTTWNYDSNLITSAMEIKNQLAIIQRSVQIQTFRYLAELAERVYNR